VHSGRQSCWWRLWWRTQLIPTRDSSGSIMAARIPLAFLQGPRRKSKPIDLIKNWHIFRGDLVRAVCGFFLAI
jgi:hypothetical protein